ncbi:hypothetical protein ACFSTC_55750 [Nonomuraea ferruginea]
MSTHDNLARVRVVRDTYLDSLRLLVATSVMAEQGGVTWAGAVMATPSGRENLEAEGFGAESVGQAGANDLVLAVRAGDEAAAEAALAAGEQAAFEDARAESGEAAAAAPRTVSGAVAQMPDASVAIVSVPGGYAALEAHHALSQGLHVLLFSDNVSLDEEAELKKRGNELGLLVMGPGGGHRGDLRHRSRVRQRGTPRAGRRRRRRGHRGAGGVGPARPLGCRRLARDRRRRP